MEGQLYKSTVIRAGQRLATMLYVPLNVFMVECVLYFLAARFLGFFGLATIVLHVVPVVLTGTNPYWVTDLIADFWFYWIAKNKGLKSNRAVTFTPAPVKEYYN
jgi:ATP/ADP translocase